MGKQESCEHKFESNFLADSAATFGSEQDDGVVHFTNIVTRRTSYEEVIHQEDSILSPSSSSLCPVSSLASSLAEWMVILQRVAEDRQTDASLPHASCRCDQASKLQDELQILGQRLQEASQIQDRVGQVPPVILEQLKQDMASTADSLRSEVSILIPSGLGRAEPEVSIRARWLVTEAELSSILGSTVEGSIRLVNSLMGVDDCCHHLAMDEDEDDDIRDLVASMCGVSSSYRDDKGMNEKGDTELGRQVLERSRKRKQARPTRSPSSSPQSFGPPWGNSSPVKKIKRFSHFPLGAPNWVTRSNGQVEENKEKEEGERLSGGENQEALQLLERKKKLVKKDGLYKFVLWREALKDEKIKASI